MIWAILPALNAVYFGMVPIQAEEEDVEGIPVRELFKMKIFWVLVLLMSVQGASESGECPSGRQHLQIRAACRKGSRGPGGTMSFCTVDGKFKTALCEDE